MKQFVKAKPLNLNKSKEESSYRPEARKNNKKYEEKAYNQSKDPREHIRLLLNEFKVCEKTPKIAELCTKYPKLFTERSQNPEVEVPGYLNDCLWYGTKREMPNKNNKQMSSDSSQPDWDSDEDKQVKLVSKKIDSNLIEKVNTQPSSRPVKKQDFLEKHERQFLEEYYRTKRHLEGNAPTEPASNAEGKQAKLQKAREQDEPKAESHEAAKEQKSQKVEDDWAEYDPNVGALINGGFLQKIQKGQEDDDFSNDDDYSYQSSSKKSSNHPSSDEDDDMFADEGPRTVTQTREDMKQDENKIDSSKEIVKISTHLFSQLAEQVGLPPQACTWVISNKAERYKVTTHYMNEYYFNELSHAFPYISLGHSQFVHCDQVKTQKGLEKLRKFNQRRRKPNMLAGPRAFNAIPQNHSHSSSHNKSRTPPPHYKPKK